MPLEVRPPVRTAEAGSPQNTQHWVVCVVRPCGRWDEYNERETERKKERERERERRDERKMMRDKGRKRNRKRGRGMKRCTGRKLSEMHKTLKTETKEMNDGR